MMERLRAYGQEPLRPRLLLMATVPQCWHSVLKPLHVTYKWFVTVLVISLHEVIHALQARGDEDYKHPQIIFKKVLNQYFKIQLG